MPYRILVHSGAFNGDTDRAESHAVVRIWLEALTLMNVSYLRYHPEAPMLYQSGVRYHTEPRSREDWQDVPTTIYRGWGDCEDLAAWRAAELRQRFGQGKAGRPAKCVFKSRKMADGTTLYHILVQHADGRIEDPSRVLGMGDGMDR